MTFDTIAEHNTIKVHMTGNSYYPRVTITRETGTRRYIPNGESDMRRIQDLFDGSRRIMVDVANSEAEISFEKWVTKEREL